MYTLSDRISDRKSGFLMKRGYFLHLIYLTSEEDSRRHVQLGQQLIIGFRLIKKIKTS